MTPVPPITEPMGKYWKQPDPNGMAFDDQQVLMTQKDFDALLEYSSSKPSGVYPGKMWKCLSGGYWYLRWFGLSEDPTMCSNHYREILIA